MKHIASYPILSQVHVGVKQVPDQWPESEEDLQRLYQQGHRFVVIDLLKDVAALFMQQFDVETTPSFKKRLAILNRLEEGMEPEIIIDNPHVFPVQNIFEVNHNFKTTLHYYQKIEEEPRLSQIRVYDLDKRYKKGGGRRE